jgi:hypothetical protein
MRPQSYRNHNFGNFGRQNAIWTWASWRGAKYTIRGREGGGFPQVRAVVNLMNPGCSWLVLAPKMLQPPCVWFCAGPCEYLMFVTLLSPILEL